MTHPRSFRRAIWLAVSLVTLLLAGSPLARAALPTSSDWLFTTNIPHLEIEIGEPEIETLRAYQWRWGGNSEERTNVLVTIREGTNVYSRVSLHLKAGAGSFRSIDDKPALTLNFERANPGQNFHGLEKLHLNNSVQDSSYLSERLCRELFLEAGVPVTRAGHATVTLNGRALGLYVLVEGWNRQFLRRHFRNTRGTLWDGGFARDISGELEINSGTDDTNRVMLDRLISAARDPDLTNRFRRLSTVLDTERFLSFAAMEILLTHWDGYCIGPNNYRVFHDLSTDRLVFMPHGLDQMFGNFRSTPSSPIRPRFRGLVANGVIQTPEGRERYLERLALLATNLFQGDRIERRLAELAALIRPALDAHDPDVVPRWFVSVAMIRDRARRRVDSVNQQLASPPQPLAFEQGKAALTRWEARRDNGNPSLTRRREGGRDLLQISATAKATGTWRTRVLLEAGHYQLITRGRVEGMEAEGVSRPGLSVRVSQNRPELSIRGDSDWQNLRCTFAVPGLTEMELVFEFRASGGMGQFDVTATYLRKLEPTDPPETSTPAAVRP